MRKPLVAVVGRPNVGKSTFFNKVCGKRISIVEDTPGVTRDRIYADAEWCGHNFTLVDTGGLDFESEDTFQKNIINQAKIAIDLADVIVFMVDGKSGVSPLDEDVAEFLRKGNKPVILIVNKLDNFELEKTYDFYALGMGEPYALSCEQSKGLGDILDAICVNFKSFEIEEEAERELKIALVGKPNVGKSSLTNRLLGEERVIVSDVAGTTRDAIDSTFAYHGKKYRIIDTAGMRKSNKVGISNVESYSVLRAMEAIRRADVVLIVFDASQEISEQDVRIAGFVHEEQKPNVVIMNKWDTIEKDTKTINSYKKALTDKLAFMDYFKPLFLSAKTGQRTGLIMPAILEVYENASRRVSTGILNEVLQQAILTNDTPSKNGQKLKIKYVTQTSINPPTFVFFCNNATLVHYSYQRYLENKIRGAINFEGTPISIIFKGKEDEK